MSRKKENPAILSLKAKNNFPIKVSWFRDPVVDANVGAIYTRYVVTANGFVIATFVDETSLHSYMKYLQQYGIKLYPVNIINILRAGAENTTVTDLRLNGPKDGKKN